MLRFILWNQFYKFVTNFDVYLWNTNYIFFSATNCYLQYHILKFWTVHDFYIFQTLKYMFKHTRKRTDIQGLLERPKSFYSMGKTKYSERSKTWLSCFFIVFSFAFCLSITKIIDRMSQWLMLSLILYVISEIKFATF
jgi:hypothetical protein